MNLQDFPVVAGWQREDDALLNTVSYFNSRSDGIGVGVEFDYFSEKFNITTVDHENFENDQRLKRYGFFYHSDAIERILYLAVDINHFELINKPTQMQY